MRVLAFCDYFSEDSSGGSERAAWEIYRRLAARGATVRVITALPPGTHPFPALQNLDVYAVPTTELQRVVGLQASLAPALFVQLRHLVGDVRPDVLHANSLFFQTSVAAALVQAATHVPLVTTAHIAGLDLLPGPSRIAASMYERTVGRFILARSRRVIAVSDSVRRHLLDLGISAARITVIPNGVDPTQFHPGLQEVGRGGFQILFVGRLIPNKGPHLLLDALLMLHRDGLGFKAVFLGDGPMRRELEDRAAPLGRAVEFRGHVRDVGAELRCADLLVRPSLTEGLPLTVLEAMASGVCVVATNIAGNRDLIEDGMNGVLVAPNDAHALANAIREMSRSPEIRQRMAAAGYATAERYSWDSAAATVFAVFEQAAGPAPSEVAA